MASKKYYKTRKRWEQEQGRESTRYSCSEVFCKTVTLENFSTFTGKHALWKKRLWYGVSCKFWEVFRRTGFLLNTSVGCFWSVNIVWKVKQVDRVEINGDQSWNMFDISKISNSLILSESLQKLLLLNSLIWYSWKMEDCMKT